MSQQFITSVKKRHLKIQICQAREENIPDKNSQAKIERKTQKYSNCFKRH